jgi:WD40 repeat protein
VATLADAHESDVNVLDWSESEPLILSGGDDGVINVWHMRSIQVWDFLNIFGFLKLFTNLT